MAIVHILDKQNDTIIGTLNSMKKEYWQAFRTDSLEVDKNIFTFFANANIEKAGLLEKRNRLLIQDEDAFFHEYIISISDQNQPGKKFVRAKASFKDLEMAKVIEPQTLDGATPFTAAQLALNGTEFEPGEIEFTFIRTLVIEKYTNPYSLLKLIATTFDLEISFRIVVKGKKIIARYVDMKKQIAGFEGKEIEVGKDLVGLKRNEDNRPIVTALFGVGPEREDGTRLTVLVENQEALERWGRKGKHLIEPYEPETTDSDMSFEQLTTLTENELNKRIDAIVTYECEAASLEHIFGRNHEKIRKGQTVRIKDTGYNPPLYLEARIREVEVDAITKQVLSCKIGNFVEFKKADLEKQVALLKQVMSDRLAKLVQSTVISSAGDVFKNGIGQTTLTAKTFLGGVEVDSDGDKYSYKWVKRDKDGNVDTSFNQNGKSFTISSTDVVEKSTFVAEVAINEKTSTVSQITISKVFDGSDGQDGEPGERGPVGPAGPKGADGYTPIKGVDYFDGKDGQSGKDGSSAYLWVKYSQNANGNPMTDNPAGALYIGVATTTTPSAPSSYTSYKWGLFKGTDGIPGEDGLDGKTSYLHVKYSDDGKTFTSNNGETVGAFIGTYVDFIQTDSTNFSDYTWNKVRGEDGYTPVKGIDYFDGKDGRDGSDGLSSFLHVRYSANSNGNPMTTNPSGAKYIGIAVTQNSTAPSSYTGYQWSLIKGSDGVPGEPGENGQTSYLHIKYSNDGGKTFSSNNGETVGEWIGTYVDFNNADSTSVTSYTWNKVKGEKGDKGDRGEQGTQGLQGLQGPKGDQGIQGPTGSDGKSSYTHIAYANSADGRNGFSVSDSSNKLYIGMYVDFVATDSSDPTQYKWTLIKGADGAQGIPGPAGEDGMTPYFHTAYATNSTGTAGFSITDPTNKTYIGTYTDFIAADSTDPTKYTWVKFQGPQGPKGDKGETGAQGPQGQAGKDGIAYMGTTAPSNPAINGTWFQTDSSGKVIAIKKWTGTEWVAAKMDSTTLSVEKLSALSADLGNVIAGDITGVTMNLAGGKFIVDANGDLFFAGELNGASGTFSGKVEGSSFTTNTGNLGNGDYQVGSFKEGRFEVAKYNSAAEVLTGLAITPGLVKQWGTSFNPTVFEGSYKFDQPFVQNPFISPSFQNFWVNYDRGFEKVGYRKDSNNKLQFKGRVASGSIGQDRPMFRLATGHIPLLARTVPVLTDTGIGNLTIFNNGDVCLLSGGNGWVSLDNVSISLV